MMTKRLSPERIAEIRAELWGSGFTAELLGHIEAIEAELADKYCWHRAKNAEHWLAERERELAEAKAEIAALRSWNENMSLEASRQEQRAVNAELDHAVYEKTIDFLLAEAKEERAKNEAEIASLQQLLLATQLQSESRGKALLNK